MLLTSAVWAGCLLLSFKCHIYWLNSTILAVYFMESHARILLEFQRLVKGKAALSQQPGGGLACVDTEYVRSVW